MKRPWTRWRNWRTDPPHPYHTLNLVFALAILGIMAYSALFTPEPDRHPVSCIHSQVSGEPCPSCGLSRAFSALVRGDTETAIALNPNAIPVFLFFAMQLVMRGLASLVVGTRQIPAVAKWMPVPRLVVTDSVLSTLLFAWAFFPLFFWAH